MSLRVSYRSKDALGPDTDDPPARYMFGPSLAACMKTRPSPMRAFFVQDPSAMAAEVTNAAHKSPHTTNRNI